jgi:CDP-glucose 4,6-dehydratase
VATVRAGNIVGGGDWARDRLLPDAVRAFGEGAPLVVRSPASTRPWQHVLDAVRGALLLAERVPGDDVPAERIAWNFGPAPADVHRVGDVADAAVRAWGGNARWRHEPDESIPESKALVLSSARAGEALGWRCAWGLERAIAESVAWYRAALAGEDAWSLAARQIEAHAADAARGAP